MSCSPRLLKYAIVWLAGVTLLAGPALAIDLAAQVPQGGLLIGQAGVGGRVWLEQRELRVDSQGRFVLGVGRDEQGPLRLTIQHADGRRERCQVAVLPRDWPTERVDGVPQPTVTPPPAIAERIAREQALVARARERDDPRSDFAAGFDWPVKGRVSGRFGSQRIYNGTPKAPHSGLDVAVPTGTPLRAPAAGVVTFAAPDLYLTGGTVLIDHGHGVSSVFLHLSRIDVKVGQRIVKGEVFGAAGATGRATGPHMHWGLNWFDVRLDPGLLVGIGP